MYKTLHFVHCINSFERYLGKPSKIQWDAVKRVLGYLHSTMYLRIMLGGCNTFDISLFSDSAWAGDLDSRKRTSGILVYFGDGLI